MLYVTILQTNGDIIHATLLPISSINDLKISLHGSSSHVQVNHTCFLRVTVHIQIKETSFYFLRGTTFLDLLC